jgi:iron complex transport system permease protein
VKKGHFLFILFLLLIISIFFSLLLGAVKTSFIDLINFLFNNEKTYASIFWEIRFPRLILAFLVGASLSLSGAILQGYFQNPMAGPFVVGVSSGASLGAVFTYTLNLQFTFLRLSSQTLFAFLSGLFIVYLVYFLSQKGGTIKIETLLLIGIALGALCSALTSFLIFWENESMQEAIFWLLGSFSLADWEKVINFFPYFFICFIIAIYFAHEMNLLVQGDEIAQSLGCSVNRMRKIFLILATFLAAGSVSVSGIIGFVGLIIPHLVRIIIGPDHRFLFPFSALLGGIFLIFSDLLSRVIFSPAELPIGIVTAIIGTPFFIYLLRKKEYLQE